MSDSQYTKTDHPYTQYDFELEIDGRLAAGFSDVSGLTMELDTVRYREGGVNDRMHELPDGFAHANLVLQRGLTRDTTFSEWIHEVMGGNLTRKDVVVKLNPSHGASAGWGWEFYNAYPRKWTGPDLSTSDGGMTIESIELVYERFSRMSGLPE